MNLQVQNYKSYCKYVRSSSVGLLCDLVFSQLKVDMLIFQTNGSTVQVTFMPLKFHVLSCVFKTSVTRFTRMRNVVFQVVTFCRQLPPKDGRYKFLRNLKTTWRRKTEKHNPHLELLKLRSHTGLVLRYHTALLKITCRRIQQMSRDTHMY